MRHITDAMVDAAVTADEARPILEEAFVAFGKQEAAMQARIRTDAGGVKLSTLGAVIPGQQVTGAKVYTTISGQFNFVIVLFSARDGRPLATLEAGALTRIRTAACSVLAASRLARQNARVLGLYGAGTQGTEHAIQMTRTLGLDRVLVHDLHGGPDLQQRLSRVTGVTVEGRSAHEIAQEADVIVTASRSTTPLFDGATVKPGAFIAAIGSSLPTTRELDDTLLGRARSIIVEWKPQTLVEAGDLVLADRSLGLEEKIVEFPSILNGDLTRQNNDEIFLYKSVGVGLEDIALAGLAYRNLAEREGWPAP